MQHPADRINRPVLLRQAWQHQEARRFVESEQLCSQLLRSNSRDADALLCLGVVRYKTGRPDEAVSLLHRSIELSPNGPNAAHYHLNLGIAFQLQGNMRAAADAFRKSISIDPNLAAAHSNLANVLCLLDEWNAAEDHFRISLRLAPGLAEPHANWSNTLKNTGRLDEALAACQQALALNPNLTVAHSNFLYLMYYHDRSTGDDMKRAQEQWNARHAAPLAASILPHRNLPDPNRRLKVGYISADFREHSVSFFLLLPFRLCNHDQIELVCYSDVATPDPMTELLRQCADQWHNTAGVPDEQLAQMIRQHEIDILVDLAGHTSNNRLLLFARKPAPVQVSYLGYPGSTGLTTMDYRLTDAWADPEGQSDRFYTEHLHRLSGCNWCFAIDKQSPAVQPPPSTKGQPVCFGSFNNLAKFSSSTLQMWAALLQAVPNSRLLLKAAGLGSDIARKRVIDAFANQQIDLNRLTLLARNPDRHSHLAMYHEVDIALDTFPYHGTTTTCEALWMGVPVVTLAGDMHVSRVGVSLLSNAGLPELVAQTPQEYVRIAAGLAADPARLVELCQTLRARMLASPLCDAQRFARDLEAAYRQMWRTWCQ